MLHKEGSNPHNSIWICYFICNSSKQPRYNLFRTCQGTHQVAYGYHYRLFFFHFDINYFVYWLETQSRHLPDNFPVNNNFSTIFRRSVIHFIICHPSKIHAKNQWIFYKHARLVARMGTWRDRVSNQYTLKQNNSNM